VGALLGVLVLSGGVVEGPVSGFVLVGLAFLPVAPALGPLGRIFGAARGAGAVRRLGGAGVLALDCVFAADGRGVGIISSADRLGCAAVRYVTAFAMLSPSAARATITMPAVLREPPQRRVRGLSTLGESTLTPG
jgi:hypothetical protein